MNWIEVTLEADGEAAEAVADLLARYGYQGVAIEQAGFDLEQWEDSVPPADRLLIRAYLPENEETSAIQRQLEEGLWHLGQLYPVPQTPAYRRVQEEDWAEAWKANYHPLRIGEHIYIRPAWVDAPPNPGDIEIVLDPGMAFGTGTHPTTQLCLVALEAHRPLPPRVLDLGCGSGILAIGAVKLGAPQVLALDIDDIAVTATQQNAALNGVEGGITAQQGSLEEVITSARRFGLIVVNILAKAIIGMCDQGLGHIVQPGGLAIFSGIIDEQADEVEAALRKTGLTPFQRRTMGEWVAIEARREAD